MMIFTVNASAQGVGAIMLYADPVLSSCNGTDGASTIFVFAVHRFHTGVTGSNFKVLSTGTGWVHLADLAQAGTLVIGSSSTGASFAYGACKATDFNFANILFQGTLSAGSCATLEIVPNPASLSGTIEGVNCDNLKFTADGSIFTVNGDPEICPCGRIIPVEETNWGQIKALYEN
jgi:hypothetical protein